MLDSMKPTQDKLEPVAAGVARLLALGLDYETIASQFSLPIETIAKVARGNLVKRRVKEIGKELDEQLVKDAGDNPVRQKLAAMGLKAADRLLTEMDNEDMEAGANASTRLKAAEKVLELGGHKQQSGNTGAQAIIMISADKVNLGKTIINNINNTEKVMPDFVDG